MELETEEQNGCNGVKRKKLALDWNQLLPTDSADDDRPPEIVVTANQKSVDGGSGAEADENQKEDEELRRKSDREIREFISRTKKQKSLLDKLPDKGEKLRENLRRHEIELERRSKRQLEKVDNECEETIQLSDHSDDGASCGKKKNDQKSVSSSSKFANLLYKKMEDKDSRTVNAFEKDFAIINPCQAKRLKSKSQHLVKEKTKTRSPKTRLVDNEKQIISNDDKKDGHSTTSFSEPNSPQEPPSRNLRSRQKRTYHLVDEEEPLTQTKLQYMEELGPSFKDVIVYYPSRDDPDAIDVNYDDMACLKPEACLSSTIMNYYIRYLQQPTSESATCNSHFFNTYFYNKLEQLNYDEDLFLKFRKWWKGVNIFEKSYIFLPIHESAHWSLVIICLPAKEDELGPFMLHLDSLGLHNSTSLFHNIKRFLEEEWSYLRKSQAPLDLPIPDEIWQNLDSKVGQKRVMVPQQKNEYDCGLFVLFYMERFIKEAPERLKKKDLSMFGKQWFRPQEASDLRSRIYDLLVQEFKKAKEKESTSASSPKC